MKMVLKLIIVCVICLLLVLIIYITAVLIFAAFREFKPARAENIPVRSPNGQHGPVPLKFNLITWNIGYGGLGKEMDFFYEGGKKIRPGESLYRKYISGITEVIRARDSIELFLFQEVDFNSKRSYYQDQADILTSAIEGYNLSIAINYKSDFIPVPYLNPMGKVNSGLMTLSKSKPVESMRLSTLGTYSWPKRLFMPKRCILLSRFETENYKKLSVINIHNSAYEDADDLRDEELKLIRNIALDEYARGNYVIIGGDWNQNPPDYILNDSYAYKVKLLRPLSSDFMPDGWKWAFDGRLPTNRDVDKPFDKQGTTCSLIDFFLVSPNIEVAGIQTIDLKFENSDHLPVMLSVMLKQ